VLRIFFFLIFFPSNTLILLIGTSACRELRSSTVGKRLPKVELVVFLFYFLVITTTQYDMITENDSTRKLANGRRFGKK
jgi:hypothetical protein